MESLWVPFFFTIFVKNKNMGPIIKIDKLGNEVLFDFKLGLTENTNDTIFCKPYYITKRMFWGFIPIKNMDRIPFSELKTDLCRIEEFLRLSNIELHKICDEHMVVWNKRLDDEEVRLKLVNEFKNKVI